MIFSFFRKIQKKLWPIEKFELKKIIPLLFIKFFISFIYGILTSLKDTLIVTEKGSGAEVIPVLKGWLVLPAAFITTIIFSKLSNHFKRATLFYGIIGVFLSFILIYAFILYPYRLTLSPHESADWITSIVGQKYQHWVSIYRNWMQALFFIVAELWGQVGIFLLFWGFSNQINRVSEAKRFYPLYIAGGDLAAIATGPLVWNYARKYANFDFSLTIQSLALYVLAFGLIVMALHWWVVKYVLTDKKLFNPENFNAPKEEKTKLSLVQGIKYIAASKYLRQLAIMVIAYGLTINLVEVTWKAHLKLQYPNPSDYHAFMGILSSSVGIGSLLVSLLLSGGVIRHLGWHFSAQITPVIVGSTGIIFLLLVLSHSHWHLLSNFIAFSPLLFIVIFGAMQNVSSKVMKWSFFDPTKEMAFIPLDYESKVKGKAAIDVVGSRLGKSGSAWIQIILIELVGTGSVMSITYFLVPIVTLSVIRWMISVRNLSKQFTKESTKKLQEPVISS